MDAAFAEFVGIFIGDGSLYVRKYKCSYEFTFTGNIHDEIPYFKERVAPLASKVLNRAIEPKITDAGRSIGVRFCSKKLAEYFKTLGFVYGPKSGTVMIPKSILKDKRLVVPCIRGIFDTDGCFTLKKNAEYPVIAFGMKSKNLILQLKSILEELGIGCCIGLDAQCYDSRTQKIYVKSYLYVNGKKNVQKWFDVIGSSNPKVNKRYAAYLNWLKNK